MPTDEKIVKEALADTGKDAKVEKVTDEMGGSQSGLYQKY